MRWTKPRVTTDNQGSVKERALTSLRLGLKKFLKRASSLMRRAGGRNMMSARQVAAAHQANINLARGLSAFADGPHHQALAAAHVAGR